ncbi:MAG: DUF1015 domain-containing protein [Deltaproteobacteria bacterium]|nr:DUF1015 domain-containing protein [Deltaproteobacteria bacterium]
MLKKFMSDDKRIRPFKGLIYNARVVGDISLCVCPPYDVIEDPTKYYKKSPYNAVRLELPIDSEGKDRYQIAKETLEDWLNKGVVEEDTEESIYVCEQSYTVDGNKYSRIGFLSLLRLDMDMIFTHEKTKEAPKKDRELLISATKTFTSFVFGLYVDDTKEIDRILRGCEKKLLYEFEEEGEIKSRIMRIVDRDANETLRSVMEKKKIYVADGHHRLEVARKINLPYLPIYLTGMFEDGTRILPYHRVVKVKDRAKAETLWYLLCDKLKIKPLSLSRDDLNEVKTRLYRSQMLSFAILRKEEPDKIHLFELEKFSVDQTLENPLRKIKVHLIHEGIIKGILQIEEHEIDFIPWLEKVDALVKSGSYDMAFLCPPVGIEQVKEIAEMKLHMPPKSTYFYPKIPTGPIFYKYA